jgi:hypothetical protein
LLWHVVSRELTDVSEVLAAASTSETEIGWGVVGWIQLAQERDQWWDLVNAEMNLLALTSRSCKLRFTDLKDH